MDFFYTLAAIVVGGVSFVFVLGLVACWAELMECIMREEEDADIG